MKGNIWVDQRRHQSIRAESENRKFTKTKKKANEQKLKSMSEKNCKKSAE